MAGQNTRSPVASTVLPTQQRRTHKPLTWRSFGKLAPESRYPSLRLCDGDGLLGRLARPVTVFRLTFIT